MIVITRSVTDGSVGSDGSIITIDLEHDGMAAHIGKTRKAY
jgi:hypothetical protein